MTPVNLTVERWSRLIVEAHQAVETGEVDALQKRASAMREAPPPSEGAGRAASNAFRWACLWFAFAEPGARVGLRTVLLALAEQLDRMLTPPEPEPTAMAVAIPVDLFAEPAPEPASAWSQRRDIGG